MKEKLKKLSLILLAFFVTLSVGGVMVNAESASSKLTIKSYSISGSKTPVKFPKGFYVKKTNSGKYVFCIHYAAKPPVSSLSYSKGKVVTDNGMNYIMNQAYENVKDDNSFFIYQTALWVYMIDKKLMTGPYATLTNFKTTLNKSNSANAKKIKNIVANAKKAGSNDTKAPTIKIATKSKDIKFKKTSDGKNYVSSKIKVNSSTSKYNVSFTSAPKNTTYKISSGYLYVYVPVSSIKKISTDFTINVNNSKSTYGSYYYQPSNKNYQVMTATYKDVKTAKDSVKMNITEDVQIKITKVDSETNKQVKGAKLVVKNSSGKSIDSWTTNGKEHVIKNLTKGTYVLSETETPDGYILSNVSVKFIVKEDGTITNSNGKVITSITYKNTRNNVIISKQDITTSSELPGATLVLKNSKGSQVDKWVSTNQQHIIKGLPVGTYTLTETIAPNGYQLSKETIKFSIDKNGKVKDASGKTVSKIIMYNVPVKKHPVVISKQDITTGHELPGATLVLKNSSGNVVDSWVSTNTYHTIEDLKAGTYTLTETIAPEGYKLSTETIKFSIDDNGKLVDSNGKTISKVVMYNTPVQKRPAIISKQDITTNDELPGATLVLKNSSGNVVDSWVSTNESHIIADLAVGTYTLTETIAPVGYKLSTETITFTMNEDGKLVDSNGKAISKVVMYNTPVTANPIIVKKDLVTKEIVAGAKLQVTDEDGNVIDTWVTTTSGHSLENLAIGTYILSELEAPVGYKLTNETIKFTVNEDGKVVDEDGNELSSIIMYNEKNVIITKAIITKKDITTGNILPGATLVVKDSNGNVVASWVSTNEAHVIEGLAVGDYTLVETKAPNGYVLSTEVVNFTIYEDGTPTEVVMYNTPEKPKEEVVVENTGSFKNPLTMLFGLSSIGLGSVYLRKSYKKDEK